MYPCRSFERYPTLIEVSNKSQRNKHFSKGVVLVNRITSYDTERQLHQLFPQRCHRYRVSAIRFNSDPLQIIRTKVSEQDKRDVLWSESIYGRLRYVFTGEFSNPSRNPCFGREHGYGIRAFRDIGSSKHWSMCKSSPKHM